jgi:NitT/TauT family transport system substrate-binding protein
MTEFSRRGFIGAAAASAAVLAGPARTRAQAPRTLLRAGYIPVVGSAQLFVLDQEGWAAAAGIDLKLSQFDSGPNMIQALASGTLDAYWAGVGPLGVARERGLDIRVVIATATEELAFVAGGKLQAFFAGGVAPADAFKRFFEANKRVARLATQPAGSVPNSILQHWLWEVGKVDKAHVEIVAMGIDATQQALLAQAVEGATVREPALTIILDRDKAARLVAAGGQMFANQPGGVFALTGDFIKREPAAAQKAVELAVRATKLLREDPDRAAPHVLNALGKGIVDLDTIKRALRSPGSKFNDDPRVIVDATAKLQDFQVKIGALQRAAPLDGLFDPSFYLRSPGARV